MEMISCMSSNHAIGYEGDMPWGLSFKEDLKYFKGITMGKNMIMGMTTFHSLPGVLPDRKHIVLSRTSSTHSNSNVVFVQSIEEALEEAGDNGIVIGGGQIYNLFLDYVDTVFLTYIKKPYEGDVFFPSLNLNDWYLDSVKEGDLLSEISHQFHIYKRK